MAESCDVAFHSRIAVLLEHNVDGKPVVYCLYETEERQFNDKNLYNWLRHCEVFESAFAVNASFTRMGVQITRTYRHELFNELIVLEDERGKKWYMDIQPLRRRLDYA